MPEPDSTTGNPQTEQTERPPVHGSCASSLAIAPPPEQDRPKIERDPLSEQQIAIARRRIEALDMKAAGFSYRTIAAKLKISVGQAHHDVQDELAALDDTLAEKAERYVDLSLRRLDKYTLALTTKGALGDTAAIEALIKIEIVRAKLLGTLAPKKIAPTTPDGKSPYQPVAAAAPGTIAIDPALLSTETLRLLMADMDRAAGIVEGEVVKPKVEQPEFADGELLGVS